MITNGPVLATVHIDISQEQKKSVYPFNVELVKNLSRIDFPSQVTFFIGENGTGKSTILEAIALNVGFGKEGGSKNIHFQTAEEGIYDGVEKLSKYMKLSWRKKTRSGYFFRAESFFTVANYIDDLVTQPFCGVAQEPYGGESLHAKSHGESFLTFFNHQLFPGGFYILDEPEAALSPQRQLALLSLIHELCNKNPETQFIIATHSPILLAYPGATIYSFDNKKLEAVTYKDTKHYILTKEFLDNPERYFKHLGM
jgi:predicted ATPase